MAVSPRFLVAAARHFTAEPKLAGDRLGGLTHGSLSCSAKVLSAREARRIGVTFWSFWSSRRRCCGRGGTACNMARVLSCHRSCSCSEPTPLRTLLTPPSTSGREAKIDEALSLNKHQDKMTTLNAFGGGGSKT